MQYRNPLPTRVGLKSTFQLPESRKKNLGNFFSRTILWRRRKRNVRNGSALSIRVGSVTVGENYDQDMPRMQCNMDQWSAVLAEW